MKQKLWETNTFLLTRYLRRGTVVQALEEQRGGIRCRRCGGKKFRLEKRFEPQEEYT